MNFRKFIVLIILFIYPYVAIAHWVRLSGTAIPKNNVMISSSGGMLQPSGNQVSYPNLKCSVSVCRGYALEVNFTGTIIDVSLNNDVLPVQETDLCYIIPYWTASGLDASNVVTNLFEKISDIESSSGYGYLYFDTVNMRTYPIPCNSVLGGNLHLLLAPSQGWINVGSYYSGDGYSFSANSKDWFLSEIELYVGVMVCSSIPSSSHEAKSACTQSRSIKTPIGKGSELPEKDPLVCNLSGDGIIDFDTVNISEINGLVKEINLDLYCNQDASVDFTFLSNNLDLNGITANLTVNDNKSIIVNANQNQNQNVKIKASLSNINNPALGDHSASTVLVYSPK